MRQHHNVLYITTDGSALHQHDTSIEVRREGQQAVRVPFHHLHAILCFGHIYVSPTLMRSCAGHGITIAFLSGYGKFLARVVGPQSGNVLLRQAQWRASEGPECLEVARNMILAKVANCRTMLRRVARDASDEAAVVLRQAADRLQDPLEQVRKASDHAMLMGVEGGAARIWFDAFPLLLRGDGCFTWEGRNRRPPRDPANATLSFLYALLMSDCLSALESVGLDPQIGMLHTERSGRPALALDLMEEFRPLLADRILFALANRRQLQAEHFVRSESGAVEMTEAGRKILLVQYQTKKQEEIQHPFLGESTTWGLLPHIQARLLARHLRGELDAYPPFLGA